jgi:hypothetical protein
MIAGSKRSYRQAFPRILWKGTGRFGRVPQAGDLPAQTNGRHDFEHAGDDRPRRNEMNEGKPRQDGPVEAEDSDQHGEYSDSGALHR